MPERKMKNHRRKPVRIFVLLVSALMLLAEARTLSR